MAQFTFPFESQTWLFILTQSTLTGSEEEVSSLSQALVLIRELLSSVDQQVLELERTHRLEEIRARLDPRAETEVRGGGVFRGSELLRRRLIHEGTLLLKGGSSRLKGWRAIECMGIFNS